MFFFIFFLSKWYENMYKKAIKQHGFIARPNKNNRKKQTQNMGQVYNVGNTYSPDNSMKMNKSKQNISINKSNKIQNGNTAAAIYFIFPMSMVLLILIFMPIVFLSDVSAVRNSGFAGPNITTSYIGVCGLFIGLSLLIPAFRKMYRAFPWLYSFTKIFYVNLIILCIGSRILNMGYQVNNDSRHTTFFILMIAQIVICRIAMCIYLKLKPIRNIE